jgi:hypothetical protein
MRVDLETIEMNYMIYFLTFKPTPVLKRILSSWAPVAHILA